MAFEGCVSKLDEKLDDSVFNSTARVCEFVLYHRYTKQKYLHTYYRVSKFIETFKI